MPRKKDKTEEIDEVGGVAAVALESEMPEAHEISPLEINFGRDDLNLLARKVNELIATINASKK